MKSILKTKPNLIRNPAMRYNNGDSIKIKKKTLKRAGSYKHKIGIQRVCITYFVDVHHTRTSQRALQRTTPIIFV